MWLAPDGNHTQIVAKLRESAIERGAKVRLVHSSHHEAWQALHSYIYANLKYPLCDCSLS